MACSVFAVLDRHGHVDQDALAQSFAEHHDFDRGYGAGVNRMLRLIRQESGDWRQLSREMFDGSGSWGNGAAMRVAPLGAWFADDLDRAASEAALSAEVTHTHPEGVAGAVAVAVAAALAAGNPDITGLEFLDEIAEHTPPSLVRDGIGNAMSIFGLDDPRSASAALGNGRYISAPDTVPMALWATAKHLDDFETGFWELAQVGGEIDTNCAIAGGIIAARVGLEGIPAEWLKRREALPKWAGGEM
jgi:ADP-ribosylglycohydrolase